MSPGTVKIGVYVRRPHDRVRWRPASLGTWPGEVSEPEFRLLSPQEWLIARDARLAALRESPESFTAKASLEIVFGNGAGSAIVRVRPRRVPATPGAGRPARRL